jgi:lipoate---protein ligase
MKYLDLNFSEPMKNLACDEVLIDCCEREHSDAVLRVWEPSRYFAVTGYSNKVAATVDQQACAADGVPVLRRFTGGGTVLQGPGCFNYSLIFIHEKSESLGDLTRSYHFVLDRHREMFAALTGAPVTIEGTSDLALGRRKFSGNSQYRRRLWTLVHGTFLLNFDLARIPRYLPMPSIEPLYRQHRPHEEFLVNLHLDASTVKQELRKVWSAAEEFEAPPRAVIDRMVRQRYARPEWNLKF